MHTILHAQANTCQCASYSLQFNTTAKTRWVAGTYNLSYSDSLATFRLRERSDVAQAGGQDGTTSYRLVSDDVDIDSNMVVSRFGDSSYTWKYVSRPSILVTDTLPDIDWTITTEAKQCFDGFTCQRATADFYGRSYEAWFIPGISTRAGVYVFHGLPGLTSELRSSDGVIEITLVDIELNTNCQSHEFKTGSPGTMQDVDDRIISNLLRVESLGDTHRRPTNRDRNPNAEFELGKWRQIEKFKLSEVEKGRRTITPQDGLH